MIWLEPAWLILLVPVGVALARWSAVSIWRRGLRAAFAVALVLALARPAILAPRQGGTLVVVADRSISMPEGSDEIHREVLDRLAASRRAEERLAVVAFGARPAVETAGEAAFSAFTAEVGGEASDLGRALEAALDLLPEEGPGRLLLLTDGRWTGAAPTPMAARAAMRGIAIDYRLLERPVTEDLAVESLDAPGEASPGEGFVVSAWIRSPVRREVEVELRRGTQVLATSRRQVPSGRSRFTFRDRAGSAGVQSYSVVVRGVVERGVAGGAGDIGPPGKDPQPENNTARFLVGIRGPRPILVIGDETSRTVDLLRSGGLEARFFSVSGFSGTLAELAGYSAVVLDNVRADELGQWTLENLAVWVRSAGGGLLMTGGQRSFGPGGYFRSPLEDILPVSMELRQEHRQMALAMVVALDRSGSMAAPVAGGRTKMDLANLATAEVLDLLSPIDEFGAIAIDSSPHVIVPLDIVGDKGGKRDKVLRVASQGGGIFVYTALRAAIDQLLKSEAGARHVLLFADAADAEEPGEYVRLLEIARASDITVSVVGLGHDTDSDAAFLIDVATRGEGRVFFTTSPRALPRIFAQDTFMVARSTFVEQPTPLRFTAALQTISGQAFGQSFRQAPPLGGYNLTYLRDGASLAAVTVDEYEAPVIATWQAGLGRTVAYTGEVDGAFSGDIAGWEGIGDLLVSLARWAAGESAGLPGDVLVTQDFRHGSLRLRLHLDPERRGDPFTEMPVATTLKGVPGVTPVREQTVLSWADPDTLEAEIELTGDEVALGRLEVPGLGGAALAPVRLPYAPEYAPVEPGSGHVALERLAMVTGGRQRIDVGDLWNDFQYRPQRVELRVWLLVSALVLLLLEVLERRTAFLSSRLATNWSWSKRRHRNTRGEKPLIKKPDIKKRPPPSGAGKINSAAKGDESAETGSVLSALDQARRRARRRIGS